MRHHDQRADNERRIGPTITGMASGETFDSLLSVRLYHVDTRGLVSGDYVLPGSPDRFSEVSSIYESQTPTTGQPQHFRLENRAGTVYWQWAPKPDKTLHAQRAGAGFNPGHAVRRDFDDELGKFPPSSQRSSPTWFWPRCCGITRPPTGRTFGTAWTTRLVGGRTTIRKMVNDWWTSRATSTATKHQPYTVLWR